jgi:two-component system, OmpR family, response regulator ChvI
LDPNQGRVPKVEQSNSSIDNISIRDINNSNNKDNNNYRILLVDDEPDVTLTFKRGLEAYGFAVDAFVDPILALSSFQPGKYDLLLLDVKMPQINGFQLYDKIKNIDRDVKACFITAHEVYYESLREIFPGIELDCFVKPIQIEDLVKHVKEELAG